MQDALPRRSPAFPGPQDPPRTAQDGPKTGQDGPKTLQDALKTPPW